MTAADATADAADTATSGPALRRPAANTELGVGVAVLVTPDSLERPRRPSCRFKGSSTSASTSTNGLNSRGGATDSPTPLLSVSSSWLGLRGTPALAVSRNGSAKLSERGAGTVDSGWAWEWEWGWAWE